MTHLGSPPRVREKLYDITDWGFLVGSPPRVREKLQLNSIYHA